MCYEDGHAFAFGGKRQFVKAVYTGHSVSGFGARGEERDFGRVAYWALVREAGVRRDSAQSESLSGMGISDVEAAVCGDDTVDCHLVQGKCSGLVSTYHPGGAKRFHRVELLNDRLVISHLAHTHCEDR